MKCEKIIGCGNWKGQKVVDLQLIKTNKMNWELLIAGIALCGSLFSIGFTIYKSRKSDKDKIEMRRHEILMISNSYFQEMTLINVETRSILSKYTDMSKVSNPLLDLIKTLREYANNTESMIEGIKVINNIISDRNEYPKIKDLRKVEIEMDTFKTRWEVVKPLLKELHRKHQEIIDIPPISN